MLNTKVTIDQSGVLFGTSGARGLVEQFTPDVCAAFTHAFVSVLRKDFDFDSVAIAIDNRPSSYAMAQACTQALVQLGLKYQYYGVIPTPALAYIAIQQSVPAIMITGSHIPFDRNGLKFYRPDGEISKKNELAIISTSVDFNTLTQLDSLSVNTTGAQQYIQRYLNAFGNTLLKGKRIGIYQHSSAGRYIYPELFSKLGADVVTLDPSDTFVPIDTEAVSEQDCQKALDWVALHKLDALFSTDGDGDRPMLADENGHWLRGDVLGLLCSKYLNIEALAVPVNCNTAIEQTKSFKMVKRTKIGSPYVIETFASLLTQYSSVAGFEANGGFLLGSDLSLNQSQSQSCLTALPTRDAVLPVLAVLALSQKTGISTQVECLPQRYTHSDRLRNFSTEKSKVIMAMIRESPQELLLMLGLNVNEVVNINVTDGIRLTLASGLIIHLRPSGNAPEFRCYIEADSVTTSRRFVYKVLKALESMKLQV